MSWELSRGEGSGGGEVKPRRRLISRVEVTRGRAPLIPEAEGADDGGDRGGGVAGDGGAPLSVEVALE